ncbi:MAG: cellulase family glycosylhydrolase [Arachnia sp.]
MVVRADGALFRDEHGRQLVLHGVNLVAKGNGGSGDDAGRGFRGSWTAADLADLTARGLTTVRLGVIWAAAEPEPGRYDEEYLGWVADQLDLVHAAGMRAFLDAHQDLYSQAFCDGAPAWATLTDLPFAPTELWSDAYLSSPAVHEALDAFWANAPGPGGVGLQDRFAAMWARVAERVHGHAALIGYDLLNEPAPGSAAPAIFGALVSAFADATGQNPEAVAADFGHPEAKVAQLARLEDEAVYRAVGDAVHPLVAAFETETVAPFVAKVAAAIRRVDPEALLFREHSYFANLGVPSGQPGLDDAFWAYAPHGYDLTVDTAAITRSSDTRAATIFARHAETAARLGVPVLVGEWGGLGLAAGVARHLTVLQDLFDALGWSWTYWCWEEGFAGSEAAAALTRPRPAAFAGDALSWRVVDGALHARWRGADAGAPSVFFAPEGTAEVLRDGAPVPVRWAGPWASVAAGEGMFELVAG